MPYCFPASATISTKPLLYYSAKLARARGYDLLAVQYPALPTGLRGHAEKIEQAVQTALSAAEEQLTAIDWTAYDRVFFLSKSIGTAIAARYAVRQGIHPRQVYYTPIEQALPYLDPTGIAFHGTADPWADTEMITDGCRKIGIPLYLTENATTQWKPAIPCTIFLFCTILWMKPHTGWILRRDRRFPFTFSALYDKIDYHNEEVCL